MTDDEKRLHASCLCDRCWLLMSRAIASHIVDVHFVTCAALHGRSANYFRSPFNWIRPDCWKWKLIEQLKSYVRGRSVRQIISSSIQWQKSVAAHGLVAMLCESVILANWNCVNTRSGSWGFARGLTTPPRPPEAPERRSKTPLFPKNVIT